jgi:hypothetical protein
MPAYFGWVFFYHEKILKVSTFEAALRIVDAMDRAQANLRDSFAAARETAAE